MNSNRIFLAGLFLFVLYWIATLFAPFLLTMTIASLLAIATSSINVKILEMTKRPIIAAFATTTLLCILFFAPIVYTIISFAQLATQFNPAYIENTIKFFSEFDLSLPDAFSFFQPQIDEMFSHIDLASITSNLLSNAASFGKVGAGFFKDMFLIIIFFFFANLYGKDIAEYTKSVMPMDEDEINIIFFEVANVMSVVFYSILITAIFEGALFAIIGMFFGYDGILLGILYGFASLIPVVGGALMWVPIAAYELANGNLVTALVISLYSVITISIIADTIIKPLIIKYINQTLVKIPTKINELLIFFAILAGLSSFGFWGMILGPAIITFFLSLLKLYKLLKENRYM